MNTNIDTQRDTVVEALIGVLQLRKELRKESVESVVINLLIDDIGKLLIESENLDFVYDQIIDTDDIDIYPLEQLILDTIYSKYRSTVIENNKTTGGHTY